VAAEPLVIDPVAYDWGPDGKFWVVEMRDYPLGLDGHGKAGGVIKYLEDTDGDGRYDKATVFLDGVNFPNGIMVWGQGVLISAAPDIFYAEDTDGDGKADTRKLLFTGFREGNQQHRVNGFVYGLDNWVYAANGGSGGSIKSGITGKTANLRGHDLRFRPDTGEFELIEGQTQFGRRRDDWGNWFGNENPTWLWHYVLPERYLARNPDLAVTSTRHVTANYPNATRVFPASRPQPRFNWPEAANNLTSANSATPYRDALFGPDYATSVFISEPAQNVVHREILEADGVTFSSHRAADEQGVEFLASSDNWFRPTMLKTGPDGALYVADVYRLVIEHPEYFPDELKQRPDLRAGDDQGRIYRVYPEGAKLRPVPRLDRLTTTELVNRLGSENGWERDTAQRLLIGRKDKPTRAQLSRALGREKNAKARVQILSAMEGLGLLTQAHVQRGLNDAHPGVREFAVQLSESFLRKGSHAAAEREMGEALLKLVNDPGARVRYQLALSLGEWDDPRAGATLAQLALGDPASTWLRTAVLSSAKGHATEMLDRLLNPGAGGKVAGDLLAQLLGLALRADNTASLAGPLNRLATPVDGKYAPWQIDGLAGFLDVLERRDGSLKAFESNA
ncbi:MAG TPA: PVC-type heme-binding CxxCH protein, partial [Verrucomicrobiae bacterium]|nr:PVC-type heme-binding CxxCH protein [Verrucomicrobiae bacterium]